MATLITGGLGFIGSHLARKLVGMSEEVVLFDVVARTTLVGDIKDKVKIVRGDLANWAEVLDVVRRHRISRIYHLGAILSADAEEKPLAAFMVNANGTFHVLEAARLFGVKQVIYTSTMATYGPGVPDRVSEDVIQMPITMYGVTKVLSERLGEYYHTKFGLDFRGVRFPSVLGPGRGWGGASAYSSIIVQEAAAGRPYSVFVDEGVTMPIIYIVDAVGSLVALSQADGAKLRRRVYVIEGFSPTAGDLANAVRKYVPGADIRFEPQPALVRIVRSWPKEADGTYARQEWGWKSRYSLDETVRDFVKEFQARRHLYE
jgi:threonine 3-dehydrogenase